MDTAGDLETMLWERWTHPQGWTYFSRVRTVEGGIELHEIRGAQNFQSDFSPSISYGSSVVAKFGGLIAHAYVDRKRWYAATDKMELTGEVNINVLRRDFWNFMRLFPAHQDLPPNAVTAACQALHCYAMEGMTDRSDSRAPFTLAESQEILRYLRELSLKADVDTALMVPSQSAAMTRFIAWILLNVAEHRVRSKYGNKTFSESEQFAHPKNHSIWFKLISVLFLFAPFGQRKHIYAAKTKSELRGDVDTWPMYVESLAREWSMFNLAATVLLSASVGFLAVPGIDSFTRTVTLFSVAFTLGSMMICIYLLWRHQTGRGDVEYHISLLQPGFEIDFLAIVLSTPFVFLAWSIMLFLISTILYSFRGFQSPRGNDDIPIRGSSSWAVLCSNILTVTIMGVTFGFFRYFRRAYIVPSAL